MISQIRKLMRDNHVTQRDLAHELGVSEQSTSDTFDVFCRVTDGGNPYRFHVLADIRG